MDMTYELIEPEGGLRERLSLPARVPVPAELTADVRAGTVDAGPLAEALDSYLRDRPEWETAYRPSTTALATVAAREAKSVHDWEGAERYARLALEGEPEDTELRTILVATLHATRQHSEAASIGDELIGAHPPQTLDRDLFVHTAESFEGAGQTTSALRLLDRAIDWFPDDPRFEAARQGVVERLSGDATIADSDAATEDADTDAAPVAAPGEPTWAEDLDPATRAEEPPRLATNRDGSETPSSGGLSIPAILAGLVIGVTLALVLLLVF